ncbi:unnamed protein product, partial [Phytomonas sp. Hart1]
MLRYETALRELASCDPAEPPTEFRMIQVLQLYDCVTRRIDESLSPYLAELLRLFRIEFCRGIFSRNPIGDDEGEGVGAAGEGEVCTFFDQINSLLSENTHLMRELKVNGAEVNIIELKYEVERLRGNIKLCENEIDRLARQNSHITQQYWELFDKTTSEKDAHLSQVDSLEKDLRAVGVENKDLQLRLFRLRKEVTDGKAKLLTDQYRQLRNSKMSCLTTLFSESDERVSILVLLSQLEFRLNEVLDRYDDKYVMNDADRPSQVGIHQKMQEDVVVLLEEMHLCVQQYRRLTCQPTEHSPVAPANVSPRYSIHRHPQHTDTTLDETDSFLMMLFDFKIYHNFISREILQQRGISRGGAGGLEDLSRSPSQLPAMHGPFIGSLALDGVSSGPREGFLARLLEAKEGEHYGGESRASHLVLPPFDHSHKEEHGGNAKADFIFASRDAWISRMLGGMGDALVHPSDGLRWKRPNSEGVISPDVLLPRLLRRPLEDLYPRKFISGVDIFTGSVPIQQRLLCSLPRVDPSLTIQIPKHANFIKVKYKSTLPLREAAYEDPGVEPAEIPPEVSWEDERNEPPAGGGGGGGGPQNPDPAHPSIRLSTTVLSAPATLKPRPPGPGRFATPNPPFVKHAAKQIAKWGPKCRFKEEPESEEVKGEEVFSAPDEFRVFRELCEQPFSKGAVGKLTTRTTGSTTTSVLISFERLDPLSPNRAPEWSLYQTLFGGFRSLIPRVLDHSVIDHILLSTCERHFTRMECRYMNCLKESDSRAMNSQILLMLAERFFRESYELSDFQRSLADELEARYCFPELVAKTFYEILCFLDAAAAQDALYSLYLEVIRGFVSPTHIHFACYMLFNMSYSWPSSDPYQVVSKDEALAMLRYLYRNADIIVHVDVHDILNDYERMSRTAPLTLNYMRSYIASIILHQEETMLLYLQGLFRSCCIAEDLQKLTYDHYSSVFFKHWNEKSTQNGIVRFLTTTLGFNKSAYLSSDDLALVVASYWASNLLL